MEIYKIKTPVSSVLLLRSKQYVKSFDFSLKKLPDGKDSDFLMTAPGIDCDLLLEWCREMREESVLLTAEIFMNDVLGYPSGEYSISLNGKTKPLTISGKSRISAIKLPKCKQMFETSMEISDNRLNFFDGIVDGVRYRISICKSAEHFDIEALGGAALRFSGKEEPPAAFAVISEKEGHFNLRVKHKNGIKRDFADCALMSALAEIFIRGGMIGRGVEVHTENGRVLIEVLQNGAFLSPIDRSAVKIVG